MGCGIKIKIILLHKIVGLLCLIFVANYILQYFEISSNFSRNYLDDLLAMPIILYMAQVLMCLIYRRPKFILDELMLLYGFLIVSLSFEWILPKYFPNLTADFWDVICYAVGTLVFFMLNRTSHEESI